MRRRKFLSFLGVAATWSLTANAQQPAKMLRVGTVAGTPRSSPQWAAFMRRMAELGYEEGKNFFLRLCASRGPGRVRARIPQTRNAHARRHFGYRPGNRFEVSAWRDPNVACCDDCHRLRSACSWLCDKLGA